MGYTVQRTATGFHHHQLTNVALPFTYFYNLNSEHDGWHFKDDVLNACSLIKLNDWMKVSSKFVPWSPIDNESKLIEVMPWCWSNDNPLPQPMCWTNFLLQNITTSMDCQIDCYAVPAWWLKVCIRHGLKMMGILFLWLISLLLIFQRPLTVPCTGLMAGKGDCETVAPVTTELIDTGPPQCRV